MRAFVVPQAENGGSRKASWAVASPARRNRSASRWATNFICLFVVFTHDSMLFVLDLFLLLLVFFFSLLFGCGVCDAWVLHQTSTRFARARSAVLYFDIDWQIEPESRLCVFNSCYLYMCRYAGGTRRRRRGNSQGATSRAQQGALTISCLFYRLPS